MKNKKTLISILAILIFFIILMLILIIVKLTGKTNTVQNAKDYISQGKYTEAIEIYDQIINSNDFFAEAYIGKVDALIALGDIQLAKESAFDYFEDVSIFDMEYPVEETRELILWYLNNYKIGDRKSQLKLMDEMKGLQTVFPDIIVSFEWSEIRYEDKEPHKLYHVFILNGEETELRYYTGLNATVTWEKGGYEDAEPYKEYEVKYINGEPTEETRYTGKTKPIEKKVSKSKKYSYAKCPICKYSAALPPENHPGHGLEGIEIFERGQNEDGSWGFWVD